MGKSIKLSHSSISLYKQCPKSYKIKYIDGYRETTLSSALFFGSALGTTWQMMALDKKKALNEEEKKIVGQDPHKFFRNLMENCTLNGETINPRKHSKVHYFKTDYERSDMTNEELWDSLLTKGFLFIDAYKEQIIPNIIEVLAIEKPISLPNEVGDEIIGFIDMICQYQTPDGPKTVLFDHKTASKTYSPDSIQLSQQLSFYAYSEGLEHVGFIVALKKFNKDNKPRIQVMIETIPEETKENFIRQADQILFQIKEDIFPRNPKACQAYGKTCEFFQLCYNGDDSNLFKKGEKA